MKIDKRHHYVLVVDTETANTHQTTREDGSVSLDMSDVLVYDCGWAVVDTKGKVYETASYVNSDIFYSDCLMKSAYYADKIPRYLEDIQNGSRIVKNTFEIRHAMLDTLDKWGIKEVAAHNARFDYNALNSTLRYVSGSRSRYWFPFGTEIWDTMLMSSDVVCQMPTYIKFCNENGYNLKNGKPRKTAEILFRFITKDNNFEESHTGLEDVLIEHQIMYYCYRQKQKMRKRLFEAPKYMPTDFQRALSANMKRFPVINLGKA